MQKDDSTSIIGYRGSDVLMNLQCVRWFMKSLQVNWPDLLHFITRCSKSKVGRYAYSDELAGFTWSISFGL